jgi:hypothetical protein
MSLSTSTSTRPEVADLLPNTTSNQHGSSSELEFLLLMMSRKCFELVNTRIHVKDARIDHVLTLIPELAKQKSIRKQTYVGLCDYRNEIALNATTRVEDVFGNHISSSASSNTKREILVALPYGLSIIDCSKKARRILRKIIPKVSRRGSLSFILALLLDSHFPTFEPISHTLETLGWRLHCPSLLQLQARGMDLADFEEGPITITTPINETHSVNEECNPAEDTLTPVESNDVQGTGFVETSLGGSILQLLSSQLSLPPKTEGILSSIGTLQAPLDSAVWNSTSVLETCHPQLHQEEDDEEKEEKKEPEEDDEEGELDYRAVAMDIARLIETHRPTQQLGPMLVSFAWQSAFMYYNLSQRIAMFGGSAHFPKEFDPQGQLVAAQWLEPIHVKYNNHNRLRHAQLSYADLYTLAGGTLSWVFVRVFVYIFLCM